MGKVNELKDFSRGQIDAALMKLGQDAGMGTAEGIRAWLAGDLVIQPKPLPFLKNEHGHYVLAITGLSLTGKQEIVRMRKKSFRVSDYAKQVLTSTDDDSYDANHRLEDGKGYVVVLVPGREITENRITANIQKYARGLGYEVPLAGVMPRVRETVSDKQIKQMGVRLITCLHAPIKGTDGVPRILDASCSDGGHWLNAGWDYFDSRWNHRVAFAFLTSAI